MTLALVSNPNRKSPDVLTEVAQDPVTECDGGPA